MKRFQSVSFVFAVGTFDGFTCGRQGYTDGTQIGGKEACAARDHHDFFPHPASVLFPTAFPLCRRQKKKNRMPGQAGGGDCRHPAPTREFLNERPDMFLDDLQNSCDSGEQRRREFHICIRQKEHGIMRSWFCRNGYDGQEVPCHQSRPERELPSAVRISAALSANAKRQLSWNTDQREIGGPRISARKRGTWLSTPPITPEQEWDLRRRYAT